MKISRDLLLLLALIAPCSSLLSSAGIKRKYFSGRSIRCAPQMTYNPTESELHQDLRDKLNSNDFSEALQILKRNPLLHLSNEEARKMLNNIEAFNPNSDNREADQKAITEACTFLYRKLHRQDVLKGFGCVDGEYPEKTTDVSPRKIEEITGISTAALTPKQRTTYWRIAGIALCIGEYFLGNAIGVDPLYTLIPATFAIFAIDQFAYRGAGFETIYQTLFPEYKKKIICHEAGHFLVSYLLGVPVRGCVTNAMEARKYSEIRGQAGTIFFDPKLSDELATSKVTRSSLDRISVVIMAGIAAEAVKFGNAEGGAVDEQSLVGFLTSISPPWNLLRIQGQARWAAMQAILLIREHMPAYNALVKALEEGKAVGDCVLAIEESLPAVLPSSLRIEERKQKKRTQEADMLMRFIQKVTWRVGGVFSADYDGSIIKGPNPHELGGTDDQEVESAGHAFVGPDGYIVGAKKDDGETVLENEGTSIIDGENRDEAVRAFTERIRKLERAAEGGLLNIQDKSEGGIWLNNLTSLKPSVAPRSPSLDVISSSAPAGASRGGFPSDVVIPPPLEGYEKRVEELLKTEGVSSQDSAEDPMSPVSLLKSHRGYQLKKLENTQANYNAKLNELTSRLEKLRLSIANKEQTMTLTGGSKW